MNNIKENLHTKRLFIFDFDGTLADSHAHLIATYNDFVRDYPIFQLNSINSEDINDLREKSLQELSAHMNMGRIKFTLAGPLIRIRAMSGYQASMSNHKMVENIRHLKKSGHWVAVITSNDKKAVDRVLGHQLEFDAIYHRCFLYKKTLAIRKCLRRFQVAPNQTYYFGDEGRDIVAAKRAGVCSVAVTWGAQSATCLAKENPDYIIHSPIEMKGLY